MVTVATASGPFEARLLAARLGADGIVWELRGGSDGVYPMGSIDVLVAAADADVARALLTPEGSDDDGDDVAPRRSTTRALMVAAAVLVSLVFVALRTFAL